MDEEYYRTSQQTRGYATEGGVNKTATAIPSMDSVHKLLNEMTDRALSLEVMAREQANVLFGYEDHLKPNPATFGDEQPDNLYARLLHINRILISVQYHLNRFNP